MRIRPWFLALLPILLPAATRAQEARPANGRAIRAIEARWEAAWNRHDIPGMIELFAPGADVVNLAGEWFHGRGEFARSLETLHAAKVKGGVWKTESVEIRFLAPDVAIVHVFFHSSGERNPDGTPIPPRRGIFTRVEERRGGRWLIVASQATKIVPPETVAIPGDARPAGE